MRDLRPVDGWEHIMRGLAGELVLLEEESEEITLTKSADIVFRDFYERGLDVEDIADETVSEKQVEEVIEYTEADIENMHELARSSHDTKKLIDEASETFEDRKERSVDEEPPVDYLGAIGRLQRLAEQEADRRGLKMRYNLAEDEVYGGDIELHVLDDEEAESAVYFGKDDRGLYVGSTESEADKIVESAEDAEEVLSQELNALAFAD